MVRSLYFHAFEERWRLKDGSLRISRPKQLAVHRCRKPRRRDIPSHVPDEDPHDCRVLSYPPKEVAQPKQMGFAPPVGRGRWDRANTERRRWEEGGNRQLDGSHRRVLGRFDRMLHLWSGWRLLRDGLEGFPNGPMDKERPTLALLVNTRHPSRLLRPLEG